ncbi:hypothetical protein HPP92_015761 [Vanilla planifolia]|uniref:Transcription termination factor MTEF18, mitochondrial-like n=1 Tax=Vanilla planifolia TaxID=51239 RepID=A0A835USC0_VANPL|nr:hypothetical protein HPP92_015761 [Vanilla planifolia]
MIWKGQFSNLPLLKWIPGLSTEKCLSSKVPTCSHPPATSVKIRNRSFPKIRHYIATLLYIGIPPIATVDRSFLQKGRHLNSLKSFCTGRAPANQPVRYQKPRSLRFVKAQAALTDYLNSTRGIYYTDAEYMSRNSPIFLGKLLEEVEDEEETDRALRRYLRYHPINEFELFFESIGLKPSEYNPFLPQDLMFLSDEQELMNNCRDLCNYGVARRRVGRIYKEAREVFKYVPGLLKSKLLAYEQLGLSRVIIIKLVVSSPALLVGDANTKMVQLLKELEGIGLPLKWIGGHLSDRNVYNWGKMLVLLHFFKDLGLADDELGTLISKHPGFLLDGSGNIMFSMISLLLKMGARKNEILTLLSEFPRIQVGSFAQNLWRAFRFLVEIEMDSNDIQKLILSRTRTLGEIFLKKPSSICTYLNVGTKRLCKLVIEDPQRLQKYALGLKVLPLPSCGNELTSVEEKKKFLYRYGFVENSVELKKAIQLFRGKGDELQERFDFLVKKGLEPSDVLQMLKKAPSLLNQKIFVMEEKLGFLMNSLGYPLSTVVAFPHCILYTTERVKLRHFMYHWLLERGKAPPGLALASIVACSEKMFMKRFVNNHPDGPATWDHLKNSCSGGQM